METRTARRRHGRFARFHPTGTVRLAAALPPGQRPRPAGSIRRCTSEYQEALHLNPDSVKTRLGLVSVLLNLGRELQASQQIDEILKLEPTNQAALNAPKTPQDVSIALVTIMIATQFIGSQRNPRQTDRNT